MPIPSKKEFNENMFEIIKELNDLSLKYADYDFEPELKQDIRRLQVISRSMTANFMHSERVINYLLEGIEDMVENPSEWEEKASKLIKEIRGE